MKDLIRLPLKVYNYTKLHGLKKTFKRIYAGLFRREFSNFNIAQDSYYSELQSSFLRSHLFRHDTDNLLFEEPPKTRLICFYLPQFHPFEENNKFWGQGFTEWTNVTKAIPQFKDHYQPRLPSDLGFYDLRLKESILAQAKMANKYGIYGFCIHYYWFSGKKIMDTPLELIFNNKDIPLRYSLCWANENWTRRWDGNDSEVLLQQLDHEDDYLNFIKDVSKYFADERYIKIEGRPLLVIYRAELLKNPQTAAQVWRDYAKQLGYSDLYLVLTESFGNRDPLDYGFDAAVDFAPNAFTAKDITYDQIYYATNAQRKVYDYESVIHSSLAKNKKRFFHSLCLAWDNSARKANSVTFHNYSPLLFGEWLAKLILKKPLHDIIFVNAWNEWAEGTYLEPDRKYGYAALQQVAEKLSMDTQALSANARSKNKCILVVHDAHLHGAQMLALYIAKTLKLCFKNDVMILLLNSGELQNDFVSWGNVFLAKDITDTLVTNAYQQGYHTVLINSAAALPVLEKLSHHPFHIVTLVHEMPQVIKDRNLAKSLQLSHLQSKYVVYPNSLVKTVNETSFSLDTKNSQILSQGVYCTSRLTPSSAPSPFKIKNTILSVGYGDHRKGLDIFIQTAHLALQAGADSHFVWVGKTDPQVLSTVNTEYTACLGKNLEIRPPDRNLSPYYENAKAFFLASREDPNPSVVLEALGHKLPIVCWEKSGGAAELVQKYNVGFATENLDPQAFLTALLNITRSTASSKNALQDYKQKHELSMSQYVLELLNFAGHEYKKISVIVPNYNYAHFLEKRLQSIVDQTYPVWEIIVLDDASQDKSDSLIRGFADKNSLIKWIYAPSDKNSGSPFSQWKKGLELASGDFIWIAESDDLADKNFLKETLKGFDDPQVGLSYCQSQRINNESRIIEPNYLFYTNDICEIKWLSSYTMDGHEEIKSSLKFKNTIPNVSSVLFRKEKIPANLDFLNTFKYAGDWFFYVSILMKSKISFTPQTLNLHRAHSNSVTFQGNHVKNDLFEKEVEHVKKYCETVL